MFSHFGKQTQGMAFTPSAEKYARRAVLDHAEAILTAFLDGREKAYAVEAVLNELQALFGNGAANPTRLIKQALAASPDDEETRLRLLTEALDLIGRQVRADRLG